MVNFGMLVLLFMISSMCYLKSGMFVMKIMHFCHTNVLQTTQLFKPSENDSV